MPNAIEMLQRDHQKVKELFRQYEAAGDRAYQKKKGIAKRCLRNSRSIRRWRKSCSTRP
jgi:serine/threonine-protein kinase RIO1